MLQPRPERVLLSSPIAASAGSVNVQLIDVSITGLKVHHSDPLPPRGEALILRFSWKGATVRVHCTTMWTMIHQLARTTTDRPVFASGVRVDPNDGTAAAILAAMVAELGGNGGDAARTAASAPRNAPYLFCELVGGTWERRPVSRPDQPLNGFTLAASEDAAQVERLCAAYAAGDPETRKLIRTLAALSIKSQGGEPASPR